MDTGNGAEVGMCWSFYANAWSVVKSGYSPLDPSEMFLGILHIAVGWDRYGRPTKPRLARPENRNP